MLAVVLLVNHASKLTIHLHRVLTRRRVYNIYYEILYRSFALAQYRTARRVYTVRGGDSDTHRSPCSLLSCRTATKLLLEVLAVLFCFHSALGYPLPRAWLSAQPSPRVLWTWLGSRFGTRFRRAKRPLQLLEKDDPQKAQVW